MMYLPHRRYSSIMRDGESLNQKKPWPLSSALRPFCSAKLAVVGRYLQHELVLTAKEAELLSVLMKQPETAFSREQLVLKVWGSNADIEPGNVDNYISFLRKRLRELHSSCEIKTIYGAGYRLEKSNA